MDPSHARHVGFGSSGSSRFFITGLADYVQSTLYLDIDGLCRFDHMMGPPKEGSGGGKEKRGRFSDI